MTKLKKGDNQLLIVIGIILFIVLFGKSDFLGALVTTCENLEPPSINGYFTSIQEMGGLVTYDSVYNIVYNGNETGLQKYRSESKMGDINLIDTENIGCDKVLFSLYTKDNTSQYVSFDKRQVLIIQDKFMWCNYNNNVLLESTSSMSIFHYLGEYIVCITEEVADNFSIGESECVTLRGTYENGQCVCIDGTLLEIGNICPDPEEYYIDIPTDEESREETGEGYITPPTQTTPSTPSSFSIDQSTGDDSARNKEIYMMSIIAILILGYAAYHFFEKGPDKGLIRKKRRRK